MAATLNSGEGATPPQRVEPTLEELLQQRNDAYGQRNLVAQLAAALAHQLGLTVGIGSDPKEPGWPVLYIELPTGQVSWHLPDTEVVASFEHLPDGHWDHHSTEVKDERIRAFLAEAPTAHPDPRLAEPASEPG